MKHKLTTTIESDEFSTIAISAAVARDVIRVRVEGGHAGYTPSSALRIAAAVTSVTKRAQKAHRAMFGRNPK